VATDCKKGELGTQSPVLQLVMDDRLKLFVLQLSLQLGRLVGISTRAHKVLTDLVGHSENKL